MVDFLRLDEILQVHEDQVHRYGGERGIRDSGMLLSAAAMPEATFSSEHLHHDLFEMAAAYLFHLVQNHPFVDGNKRTGAVVALVFLALNGIMVEVDQDTLADFVIEVASGNAGKADVAEFLRCHAVS